MEGGAVVVDPCGVEQAQQTASATLAVMPSADLVRTAAAPSHKIASFLFLSFFKLIYQAKAGPFRASGQA